MDFMSELINRASYGLKGEKPIAVIAALKYLDENKLLGKRLSELFPPHTNELRPYFIDLAKRYSSLSNPSSSWSVIVAGEIQNSIRTFDDVDKAFSELTEEEIKLLLAGYVRRLEKPRGLSQIRKAKKKPTAFSGYSFEDTDKPPETAEEDIGVRDRRVTSLLEFGKKIRPRELFPVLHEDAAQLIEKNPFAFALAAVLDRGTKSEIIWTIPYYLEKSVGDLSPNHLENISIEELERILRSLPVKPRYITDAPRTVKELSKLVAKKYKGDVSKIWQNTTSSYVKATFQRIYGVGPGIASMIVLLLERCFGIRFTDVDHKNMDVKPDVHIIRVFHRLGLIAQPNEMSALNAARKLNPEYPGALDPPTWIIGRKWCTPFSPQCYNCPLNKICPRNAV